MNKKCQVFTPNDYVKKLLDSVGYLKDLYGKKFMENSCGDGNILVVAVKRYIEDCRAKGLSRTKIRNGLQKDIFGVEVDKEQYEKCIKRINSVIDEAGISPVKWQIVNDDYLKRVDGISYDYIVGNPPYITYSEIEKGDREFLRTKYTSCKKGKFDYCYAFLEKSINELAPKGNMAYLIPSSVYKTVYGEILRNQLLPYVTMIEDYTQEKVFQNALVKSSIIVLSKDDNSNYIGYIDKKAERNIRINRNSLGSKWVFDDSNYGRKRFGDYFKVSHVVATLYNKAYVLKDWKEDNDGNIIVGKHIIEKKVVRDAASPRAFQNKKDEKIIFPYSYDEGHNLIRYTETEFESLFPGAKGYLNEYRDELDKRDKDVSSLWFEYGRSQALNNLDHEKVLISTIISKELPIHRVDKECIPYAGMFVTARTDEMTINEGIMLMKQPDFSNYLLKIGIPINGTSVRVTSKDIEEYRFY